MGTSSEERVHLGSTCPGHPKPSKTRRTATSSRSTPHAPADEPDARQDLRSGPASRRRRRRSARAAASSPSAAGVPRVRRSRPELAWPDPEQARGMTTTEQIVWPIAWTARGRRARRDPAGLCGPAAASDGTAPFAIHTFNQTRAATRSYPAAGGNRQRPLSSSREGRRRTADRGVGRDFAGPRPRKPYYAATPATASPLLLPEQGLVLPGQFLPAPDSHQPGVRRVGAVVLRCGVHDARLRGWSRVHLLHAGQAAARRVPRKAPALGLRKDIVLELLRRWGPNSRRAVGRVPGTRPAAANRLPHNIRSPT